MKTIKKIGLAKLFLWQEAERIQTWPEAFANLEQGRTYTRPELAQTVFRLFYKSPESKRLVRGDQMNNCFGLQPLGDDKTVIHGVNFFQYTNAGRYLPSSDAVAIGQAWLSQENENQWTISLARQIARFEIRTRLMLYLLGQGGFHLVFKSSDFFALPTVRAKLMRADEVIEPFNNNGIGFNTLLQTYCDVALGPFWKQALEAADYEIADDFIFEGVRSGAPSTNKLHSNIKGSLFLMKYLGVLENDGQGWTLHAGNTLKLLGESIAREFIDISKTGKEGSPLLILQQLTAQMQDNEGFVIVSRLARAWAGRTGVALRGAEESFDRFIREQTYKEHIRIRARHQGQPRHGRGLYGDDGARKIKIEF